MWSCGLYRHFFPGGAPRCISRARLNFWAASGCLFLAFNVPPHGDWSRCWWLSSPPIFIMLSRTSSWAASPIPPCTTGFACPFRAFLSGGRCGTHVRKSDLVLCLLSLYNRYKALAWLIIGRLVAEVGVVELRVVAALLHQCG